MTPSRLPKIAAPTAAQRHLLAQTSSSSLHLSKLSLTSASASSSEIPRRTLSWTARGSSERQSRRAPSSQRKGGRRKPNQKRRSARVRGVSAYEGGRAALSSVEVTALLA